MNDQPDVNTKDALLGAAMEVFADKGFDAATVRDICGRAKANVAAVNYHYGGKDALYVAVLKQIFPQGEYLGASGSSPDPEVRLRHYLLGMASEIYEHGNHLETQRWAIFLREMAKPSKNLDFIVLRQVQPRAEELRGIIGEILGPNAPEDVISFTSSNVWALMLAHLLTQPVLDRLKPKRPSVTGNMDAFIDNAVTFALGGMQAVKESMEA